MATSVHLRKIWLTSFDSFTCVRHNDLGDISYTSQVIAYFVSNFIAVGTLVGRGRICLTSVNSLTQKTRATCKNLGDKWVTAYRYFISNFVAMATRFGCCEVWLTSFDSFAPKTPVRREDLRHIFCTNRVTAYSVFNFAAMATRVGCGRIWQHSIARPYKPSARRKNLRDISNRYEPCYSQFCLKFHCHGNAGHPGVPYNQKLRLSCIHPGL